MDPGEKLLFFAGGLGAVAGVAYFVFKKLTSKIRPTGWPNANTSAADDLPHRNDGD